MILWNAKKGHWAINRKGHWAENRKGFLAENRKGHWAENRKGHWTKNINAMEWIKPEESENLSKMAENHQRTSLKNLLYGKICVLQNNGGCIGRIFSHEFSENFF